MAIIVNTAPVNGPIAPIDSEDVYPTHFAKYGKGGFYTVSTLAERNSIPLERREAGLTVIVTSGTVIESSIYTLDTGLTNNDWTQTLATNATVSILASTAPGGFKNKIIGGDFLTNPWQRGTLFTPKNSFSGLGGYRSNFGGRYTADCFSLQNNELNADANKQTFRTSKELLTDGSACLKVECTSTLTLDTFSFASVATVVEGYNYASLHQGVMTLSFWVYSSLPGKYAVSFRNYRSANCDASWVANYTINNANTWEKKVIVVNVPASESGGSNWNFDEKIGVLIDWWLHAAPVYSTNLTTQWVNTSPTTLEGDDPGYVTTSGCVNAAVSGATFKLKDVQLEAGTTASTFERLDVGTVLRQCQRYYQKSWSNAIAPLNSDQTALSTAAKLAVNAVEGSDVYYSTDNGYGQLISFPVNMKSPPTVTAWVGYSDSGVSGSYPANALLNINTVDILRIGEKDFAYGADSVLDALSIYYWAYVAWTAESNLSS